MLFRSAPLGWLTFSFVLLFLLLWWSIGVSVRCLPSLPLGLSLGSRAWDIQQRTVSPFETVEHNLCPFARKYQQRKRPSRNTHDEIVGFALVSLSRRLQAFTQQNNMPKHKEKHTHRHLNKNKNNKHNLTDKTQENGEARGAFFAGRAESKELHREDLPAALGMAGWAVTKASALGGSGARGARCARARGSGSQAAPPSPRCPCFRGSFFFFF